MSFERNHNDIPTILSPGAAALVSIVDRIIYDPEVPTLATGFTDDGEIVLILGKSYFEASDELKAHELEHEACHVALKHMARFKALDEPRNPKVWNLAADAAIHHRCLDPQPFIDAPNHPDPVTFETLEIPPCTPEVAYNLLMKNVQTITIQIGCGHGEGKEGDEKGDGKDGLGDIPDWAASEIAKAVEEAAREIYGKKAGSQRGQRPSLGSVCDPPPKWMVELLAHLQRKPGRRTRKRSWQRENRRNPDLPGRARRGDKGALVLVDCSASMADDTLRQVAGLLNQIRYKMTVVLWAVDSTERLTTGEALALLKSGKGPGGGTDPTEAATHREWGERSIWITDGYVGRWPKLTPDDIVLTTAEHAPAPAVSIKIGI